MKLPTTVVSHVCKIHTCFQIKERAFMNTLHDKLVDTIDSLRPSRNEINQAFLKINAFDAMVSNAPYRPFHYRFTVRKSTSIRRNLPVMLPFKDRLVKENDVEYPTLLSFIILCSQHKTLHRMSIGEFTNTLLNFGAYYANNPFGHGNIYHRTFTGIGALQAVYAIEAFIRDAKKKISVRGRRMKGFCELIENILTCYQDKWEWKDNPIHYLLVNNPLCRTEDGIVENGNPLVVSDVTSISKCNVKHDELLQYIRELKDVAQNEFHSNHPFVISLYGKNRERTPPKPKTQWVHNDKRSQFIRDQLKFITCGLDIDVDDLDMDDIYQIFQQHQYNVFITQDNELAIHYTLYMDFDITDKEKVFDTKINIDPVIFKCRDTLHDYLYERFNVPMQQYSWLQKRLQLRANPEKYGKTKPNPEDVKVYATVAQMWWNAIISYTSSRIHFDNDEIDNTSDTYGKHGKRGFVVVDSLFKSLKMQERGFLQWYPNIIQYSPTNLWALTKTADFVKGHKDNYINLLPNVSIDGNDLSESLQALYGDIPYIKEDELQDVIAPWSITRRRPSNILIEFYKQ